MREIKYRILVGDSWHYWGFIQEHGSLQFRGIPSTNYDPMTMEEAQERSCEYTGLKDKNGVEIYEGDIVRYAHGVYPIEFAYSAWCVHKTHGYEGIDYEAINGRIEVIGNIHANPELLEGRL